MEENNGNYKIQVDIIALHLIVRKKGEKQVKRGLNQPMIKAENKQETLYALDTYLRLPTPPPTLAQLECGGNCKEADGIPPNIEKCPQRLFTVFIVSHLETLR